MDGCIVKQTGLRITVRNELQRVAVAHWLIPRLEAGRWPRRVQDAQVWSQCAVVVGEDIGTNFPYDTHYGLATVDKYNDLLEIIHAETGKILSLQETLGLLKDLNRILGTRSQNNFYSVRMKYLFNLLHVLQLQNAKICCCPGQLDAMSVAGWRQMMLQEFINFGITPKYFNAVLDFRHCFKFDTWDALLFTDIAVRQHPDYAELHMMHARVNTDKCYIKLEAKNGDDNDKD